MTVEKANVMREVFLEKLCLNINLGPNANKVNEANSVLKDLTGQNPFNGKSRLTIRSFGIRRNQKISSCVTVKKEKAMEILDQALRIKEYVLPIKCFSSPGVFSFGIEEHIDLGMKYDPAIGIFGMHFNIILGRKGYRVARRKRKRNKIGSKHLITKEEAITWFRDVFDGYATEK